MRIAVPTWEGRVSPVFDTARRILVVHVENGEIRSRREESLAGGMPPAITAQLGGLGVNVLICGAVSRPLANMIVASGIELIPFAGGDVDEILRAFLAGKVLEPAFLMPGCRRMRGGVGRRRCRGGKRGEA